jgi:hypothetical protein
MCEMWARVHRLPSRSPKAIRSLSLFGSVHPKLKADATTPISFAGVALAAAPYTPLVSGSANVGRDWKLEQIAGIAAADAAGGTAMVSMHLGAAKTMLEFGPIFVLDLGKAGRSKSS